MHEEDKDLAKRGRKKKEELVVAPENTVESRQDGELEEGVDNEKDDSTGLKEDFEENDSNQGESVPEVEVQSKDHGARLLEIRRAIEERAEQRKFKNDLDYLDEEL